MILPQTEGLISFKWNDKKILSWQKKWYLQADHKRLGRIIVEFAKSYQC